ncbi:MAG: hypothetical protein AAF989_07610, partial [Planctomycetota bacterium]
MYRLASGLYRKQSIPTGIVVLLLITLLPIAGCSVWSDSSWRDEGAISAEPRTASSSVLRHHSESIVLNTQFISVDWQESFGAADSSNVPSGNPNDAWDAVWKNLDEASIDHEARSRLLDNGLRVGIVRDLNRL